MKHFSQKSLGTGTVDEILHPTNPIDRLLLACIYIIYIMQAYIIKGSLDEKLPSYEVLKMRENRCVENGCVENRCLEDA